jgi:hypothetical protein
VLWGFEDEGQEGRYVEARAAATWGSDLSMMVINIVMIAVLEWLKDGRDWRENYGFWGFKVRGCGMHVAVSHVE